MRWEIKPKPKVTDVKYIIRFALMPRKTDDNKRVWLEKYIVKYQYLRPYDEQASWHLVNKWSKESDVWKEVYDYETDLILYY